MEFEEFEPQEDNDEEDAAIQYMIEQSLLESIKQMETLRDPTTTGTRRSDVEVAEVWSATWWILLSCP